VMVFFLARKRFDPTVAWISAALFLGTDLFWRFSISGLSTMLLIVIFIALVWCLSWLEEGYREAKLGPGSLLLLAILAGLLTGLGGLTRYAFGLLIIPVLIYLILFFGRSRVILCLAALVAFAMVMSPWVIRNYHVSHTPFGTAGYAMYEATSFFPEHRLERSLNPDLSRVTYRQLWSKFIGNTRIIMHEDLPKLAGGWLGALFFVGLLVGFRNPTLNRLRYFLLLCLPVLMVAQAMGRTQLSEDSPVINSENLLVLLAPIIIIYGVSFFFTLLDQMDLPVRQLRYLLTGVFCTLVCLPAVFSLVSSRKMAFAFPPYNPAIIQKTAGWTKENELMMSDVPWAVAWYGQRQCLWATLGLQTDFFSISDYQKPISAIYLTTITMDQRFLSQWIRNSDFSWGGFVLEYGILKKPLPGSFPLKKALPTWMPDHFILMDYDRWNQAGAPQ
ncbi:MAG TPA: glycosyltransferase family 39 protein, partial [Verrucomicrobiae bacterium]|nr:glycosyltransferase family 39 protein [Verrucomicrobiae bacterium]